MIGTILMYAFVAYIGVAGLLAIFLTFTIFQLGGWEDLAEFTNKITSRASDAKVTSLSMQWGMAITIILWPLLLPIGFAVKKKRGM